MKNIPALNLKAVMQMTGLRADTLRAWERRYHLPKPERTPGGQRLYSQHDISILKWLMTKQSEGMSISNAVSLWNDLVDNGNDPLREERPAMATPVDNFTHGEMNPSLDSLRGQWKQACLDFNESLADQIANYTFAITLPEIACKEIFLQGLFELGEGWYQGEVTVQQEHFASGLVVRRLGSLISSTPPANRNETILMCCPPGEEHSLSGDYLTFLLRRHGYKVIDLGAKTPIPELKETILKIKPDLVVLSAQQLVSAVQLKRAAEALTTIVPVGIGGRTFLLNPGLKKRFPAYYLGDTLETAPGIIENILNNKPGAALIKDEFKNPYGSLHELFEFKLQTVYSLISILNSKWDSSERVLSIATHFTNDVVSAALYFGDLDLLLPEFRWVEGFLKNRHYRPEQITDHLRRYADSIHKVLGQEAAPLINWFYVYLSRQKMLDGST